MKRRNSSRGLLATILKTSFAVAVIAWLVWSGRLDITQIARAGSDWPRLVAVGAFLYLQIVIMAWRWRVLSAALGFAMSPTRSFGLTMIGMLFNTAMPGAVSGDVVKAYYAAGGRPDTGGRVASIIVDRIVGLFSLITVAVCGAAWNTRALAGNTALRGVWLMLLAILAAAAAGFAGTIMASGRAAGMLRSFSRPLPLRGALAAFLEALAAYNRKPLVLLTAFLMSIPCHLMSCAAFGLALSAISPESMPVSAILFIVPVGLTTTALPVTPAGIGVGQAAFYALFEHAGRGQGTVGSAAFTLYQLVLILVNLSGVFFYVKYSRKGPERAAVAAAD